MRDPYRADITMAEHIRFYYLKLRTHMHLRSSRWARRRMNLLEALGSVASTETTTAGSWTVLKSRPQSSPEPSSSTTDATAGPGLTRTTSWFRGLTAIRSMDDQLFTRTVTWVAMVVLSVPLLAVGARLLAYHTATSMVFGACVILPTLLNLAIVKVRR